MSRIKNEPSRRSDSGAVPASPPRGGGLRRCLLALVCLGAVCGATAGPGAVASDPSREERLRATGDWGGTRSELEGRGLIVAGAITLDASAFSGPRVERRDAVRGLFGLGALVELEPTLGWAGASFFAGVHALRGRNGSELVGDYQGFSNIDVEREFADVAELWLEQRLFTERLRFKLGRVDANSEFAFSVAGTEFINSSAGYSPTILFLPTYPRPAPSVNLFAYPTRSLRLGAAVYRRDEAPEAAGANPRFGLLEATLTGDGRGVLGPRRLAIGAWHDTAGAPAAEPDEAAGATSGVYLVAEQRFRLPGRGRWIDACIQYGRADRALGDFAEHLAFGVVAPSPFAGRRRDLLGGMFTEVGLGRGDAAVAPGRERVIELFYAIPLTGYLRLKPDLQWIDRPGGRDGSVLAATLRLELAL